jgi:hypothetical protein
MRKKPSARRQVLLPVRNGSFTIAGQKALRQLQD